MDRGTERKWQTGLQYANFASNLLNGLYQLYARSQQQSQAGEAYQDWQRGRMLPSTATQSGSVAMESPLGGGKTLNIPTFETQGPRMGPVDENALVALYGAMAGVQPEVASPYLEMGRQLYGTHAEGERYRQQRADTLDDRTYTREQEAANRGFQTRASVAGTLTGEKGDFDISNPQAYINYVLSGNGEILPALTKRPDPVTALGVIPGKGGAFIPFQQGTTFSGASVKSDIPLKDPTIVRTGSTGSAMTDAEARGLTDAYSDLQVAEQQLTLIAQQEAALNQQLKAARSYQQPDIRSAIAELQLKKVEIQGKIMGLRNMIQTRETGQVIRGGTQPAAPQKPY